MRNIIFIVAFVPIMLFGQYQIAPSLDPNFNEHSLSDPFNLSKESQWFIRDQEDMHWGQETFNPDYVDFTTIDGRQVLRLKGAKVPDAFYTGGISISENNTLNTSHYGYYEIEAKLDPQYSNYTLWPCFWLVSGSNSTTPKFYEEIDIFESTYNQWIGDSVVVGEWYIYNDNYNHNYTFPDGSKNTRKIQRAKYDVDFEVWHTYGIYWDPEAIYFFVDDNLFTSITQDDIDTESDGVFPYHDKQNIHITLQVTKNMTAQNGVLGYYYINYFNYSTLVCLDDNITASEGQGYNFSNHDNEVKGYCDFSQVTVNANSFIRFTDYVNLTNEFIVPLGKEISILPTVCN